jgi:hypothetical protein
MRTDTAEAIRIWDAASAGLLGGAVVSMGKINLTGFKRTRGTVAQDATGTVVINQYAQAADTTPASSHTVVVDATQPPFRYSWDVAVLHPYVEIFFTNDAGVSTFFRASAHALPT